MFNRLMVAALTAIALAVSAGCGGSGGAEPLTKAQFTKQADRICAKTKKEFTQEFTSFVKEQPNEEAGRSQDELFAATVKTIVLPLTQAKAEQIEALAPPVGGQKRIAAYLASLHTGISAVRRQEANSFASLNDSLTELEKLFLPSHKLALAYGMQEC